MTGPLEPVVSVAPAQPETVLALKEWAAVVHALVDGRQTVLLRKGGIHEKRFTVRGSRFVVFPTVAHSHAESTRPEHAELLAIGLADVGDASVVVRPSCPPKLFHESFAADLPAEQAALMAATQRPVAELGLQ